MKAILAGAGAALLLASAAAAPVSAQAVSSVYTKFNSKQCTHTRGRQVEDYGSWQCAGHQGIGVRLSAGDQRMQVSFGRNAARELAAEQTFPGFNNVYEGTIEWRIEMLPNGKTRPFATILRWNVRQDGDENRRESTVVSGGDRLGPEACATSAMRTPAPMRPTPTSWRGRSPISTRGPSIATRTSQSSWANSPET
jgi:hypothetical protein